MIIVKSELEGMKTSTVTGINNDTEDADMLSTITGQFITVLQGKNFEGEYKGLIIENLESYKNATKKRRELSIELSSKIESSLNILIESMGTETTIDTSKKEELKTNYANCQTLISNLQSQASSFEKQYNETKITAYKEQLSGINRDISAYETRLAAIKADIEKIERVELADAEALSNLSGLDEMLLAYKTLTSEIEALKSNIPSYTPPAISV